MFDFDINDWTRLDEFMKDIPVKTDITKTPNGYAIVCENRFDTRSLFEKWKTEIKKQHHIIKTG